MDLKKAAELQRKLSNNLVLHWVGGEVKLVAGADFSYDKEKKKIGACVIIVKIPEFETVEIVEAVKKVRFPYIGLASFVGVILDICTIGCAKSPIFPFILPGERRGEFTYFRNDKNEKVGICLRTRAGVKPVFVSPGNRIDFMESVKLILGCSKFRIPEPLRKAHTLSGKIFLNLLSF